MTEMCLYNGTELRDINSVWKDKKTYPCAFVKLSGDRSFYVLCLFKGSAGITNNNGSYAFNFTEPDWVRYDLVDGEWVYYSSYTTASSSLNLSADSSKPSLVWTSVDAVGTDGTLYMAASEPIPLITLTYEGEPRAEDIVGLLDEQYLRLSDKPYDLRHVYSATAQAAGEAVVSGEGKLGLVDMGYGQAVMVGDMGLVMTIFADLIADGVLFMSKGTYSSYIPDAPCWISKAEGAMKIDGDMLVFTGTEDEYAFNGWTVKVSDKIYDLNSVMEVVCMVDDVATVYNQFSIMENAGADGLFALFSKPDGRPLAVVSLGREDDWPAGTYFAGSKNSNAVDAEGYYTVRALFAKEIIDIAEKSVGEKFLLYGMFHPMIARALCATGGNDATRVQFIVTGDEAFTFSSANKAVYFKNEDFALKTREQLVNATCTHFTYGSGNVLAEMKDGEFIFNITVADGLTTGNVSFKNNSVFTSRENAVAWFKEQLANGTPVTVTCYIKDAE